MNFNKKQIKKGGIGMALALGGAVIATTIVAKSPEKIKKYVPGGVTALALAGSLFSDNENINNLCYGAGVIGVSALKTQLTEAKPSDVVIDPASGTVQGLSGLGNAKSIIKQLLPDVGAGSYNLGNVATIPLDMEAYNYNAPSLLGAEPVNAMQLL